MTSASTDGRRRARARRIRRGRSRARCAGRGERAVRAPGATGAAGGRVRPRRRGAGRPSHPVGRPGQRAGASGAGPHAQPLRSESSGAAIATSARTTSRSRGRGPRSGHRWTAATATRCARAAAPARAVASPLSGRRRPRSVPGRRHGARGRADAAARGHATIQDQAPARRRGRRGRGPDRGLRGEQGRRGDEGEDHIARRADARRVAEHLLQGASSAPGHQHHAFAVSEAPSGPRRGRDMPRTTARAPGAGRVGAVVCVEGAQGSAIV